MRHTSIVIALVALVALPATAAARTMRYSVVQARGFERITFSPDAATCATFGTCGRSGRVSYRFTGKPHGRMVLHVGRRGRVTGGATFRTSGVTTATASTDGETCSATVRRRREVFSLRRAAGHRSVRFTLHPRSARRDYLKSACLTPTEADLAHAGALPKGSFRLSDFDHFTAAFRLTGSTFVREGGYRCTVEWDLRYRLRRR